MYYHVARHTIIQYSIIMYHNILYDYAISYNKIHYNVIEDNINKNLNQEEDELYPEAVQLVISKKRASTSFIQRHFKIGYNRAANIIEKMEQNKIVSEADKLGRREVLG